MQGLHLTADFFHPMGSYVPLYGSYRGFAVASDTLDPLTLEPAEVERRIAQHGLGSLSYYNGDTHRALFALPNYFRRLVQCEAA